MNLEHEPRRPRIVTTRLERRNKAWAERAEPLAGRLLPFWDRFFGSSRRAQRSLWRSLLLAAELLAARRQFDVLVSGSERGAHLFALIEGLLPGRKTRHVMIGCLWQRPRTAIGLWVRRGRYRIEARAVCRFVVWSRRQARYYHDLFRIPEGKIAVVPFHTTLDGYDYSVRDEGYVFSGGDSQRDYRTLVEAVRGLEIRVVIAVLSRSHFRGLVLPDNVEVTTLSAVEFRERMARARVVVVPMKGGLVHSGGYQTYLNAMAMGKPVVVADDVGADEYISDGVDGFIVPPGSADDMRAVLRRLLDSAELRAAVGTRAAKTAERYSMVEFVNRLVRLAEECAAERVAGTSS
jgi:glycosyltransferase involved in cell wall biosynthesis